MQFGVILSFIRQILAAERTRRIFHEGTHVLLIDACWAACSSASSSH